MTEKLPTIDIKGKEYVQVKDRILYFTEKYGEKGSIRTELLSSPDAEMVVVKATVIPDTANPDRYFTGHSQAKWTDKTSFVNATSAMENAETSAVGRALALMGIGVIESVASADEVKKAVKAENNEVVREVNPDECEHKEFWINEVKNADSPNKGKKFKSCKACKKFLGWYSEPEK